VASLRTLEPELVPIARAFVAALKRVGYSNVVVTSVRRDASKQAKLYADYKAGRSRYPAAPPGRSTHGLGIAFDLHLEPSDYSVAGAIWESLGLRWGGRFGDPIHFDFHPKGWTPSRGS
jgi:D-alanyl-D-alanine carboxypeptidase